MDFEGDSQPLFDDGLAPLKAPSYLDTSDSEDELNLSSLADNDAYSRMNISEKMKNILRMDTQEDLGGGDTQDDSESDDDSIFKGPRGIKIDIEKLNQEIAKNKYTNFPFMSPPVQETAEERQSKVINKIGSKLKEMKKKKKKRRDKDNQKQQKELAAKEAIKSHKAKDQRLDQLLVNFATEASDSEAEEEDQNKKKKKKKQNQLKGRRSRKQSTNTHKVDENGERLVRTTEFLDTDTDDSSSDEERVLSKKQELEMARESERLRRTTNVGKLKPAYIVKSFDEFVKRREERELNLLNQLETTTQKAIQVKLLQMQLKEQQEKKKKDEEDEEDDLIIVGDSKSLAKKLKSPDHTTIRGIIWSPVKQTSIKTHNQYMLNKITNEGYQYRIKMEEAAKAKGHYVTPTERAKKLLEKEQNALLIDAQVKLHFEKNRYINNEEDKEDEEDEDYNEEEEEEEEEFIVQDVDDRKLSSSPPIKRKIDHQDDKEDEDNEDQDMGVQAMKRWKSKKMKRSIFDDSDDEEEFEKKKKVATTQKPLPAHSISNFFKAKATVIESEETMDKPPLIHLKRIIQRQDDEKDLHDMDMDNEEPESPKLLPKQPIPFPSDHHQSDYLEQEAEESEDEFFGAGGQDEVNDSDENLDEFEEDGMLVHETIDVDEAQLRDAFNRHEAESDINMIQRLLKDVTGGGLRKQKAAAEAGIMLDDLDLYDEEENDLIAIRRAAEARRRKFLKKNGTDPLDNLMNDPKTAAFAKAALPDKQMTGLLSDDDQDDEEIVVPSESLKSKLVIQEDEDDIMDIHSDIEEEENEEEDGLIVHEYNSLKSPIKADDEEPDDFLIESIHPSKSPLNQRRAQTSMFGSPSSMERYKRLFSETNGLSDTPRVGFASSALSSSSSTTKSGEEEQDKKSSIGAFLMKGQTISKQSLLGRLREQKK